MTLNLAICTPTENRNKLVLSLLDKITHESVQFHCRGTTNNNNKHLNRVSDKLQQAFKPKRYPMYQTLV